MTKPALAALAATLAALPAVAINEPGGLPPRLRAPAAEEPAFMLSAEGVHVFECRAVSPTGFAWTFVAPDATLYEGGRSAATHTSPNFWESSSDRSSVAGTVRSVQPVGADDLPWVLLGARAIGESGLFADVTSIQRVNTAGGVAPASGCDASHVGSEARVPFTAQYYFYRRRGAG